MLRKTPIRLRPSILFPTALACAGCAWLGSGGPYDTQPTAAQEAVSTLTVVDGFEVELFASEPDVIDPVEMAFDEHGRLYVAEMLDYPTDPAGGAPPRSRIRLLEDLDGDGALDRSTVFAEGILQASSVLPWKGGVFVTSAPDILFLEDVDGDRRADTREVWFSGFRSGDLSPEARVANLRLGIDNWIYAANSGQPGRISSPKWPEAEPVEVRGHDFRFHPATGRFEPATGPTQFGMTFDEWGERFLSHNTIHLRHAVLPARYFLRNRYYAPPARLSYPPGDDPSNSVVFPLTQPQLWRVERTQLRQAENEEKGTARVERVGGHFTAAAGATVYVGDSLPEDARGDVFVADANGSLVRRERLEPSGVTFRAVPMPRDREFLASTDVWFRPVNFANGPDGCLYMADFYREYIEEPRSIPDFLEERLHIDFSRGNDRGRIFRITSAGADCRPARPLATLSRSELAAQLGSANGWNRRNAQRLIIESGDAAWTALVEPLLDDSSPLARLHALWTLEGLGGLRARHVRNALHDSHPGIRRHAARLAEAFAAELSDEVKRLIDDPDERVRFQTALSLGAFPEPVAALVALARTVDGQPWMQAAILRSAEDDALQFLLQLLRLGPVRSGETGDRDGLQLGLIQNAARLAAAPRRPDQVAALLRESERVGNTATRIALLTGVDEGLSIESGAPLDLPAAEQRLLRLVASDQDAVAEAAAGVATHFRAPGLRRRAMEQALDEEASIQARVRAISLLRGGDASSVEPALFGLLDRSPPLPVQAQAVKSLASLGNLADPSGLLVRWRSLGPRAREELVTQFSRSRDRALLLVEAIEQGDVASSSLTPAARSRLANHPDAEVRERASEVVGEEQEREAVVERYRDVLNISGDAAAGERVFENNCAKCHSPATGEPLGPELNGIQKGREELLSHILNPSFEIEPDYTSYVVVAKDGEIHDGLLAAETTHSVTLRTENGATTIARTEIDQMRVSEVSLMPDGLEKDLSRRQLADVMEYLLTRR